MELAMHYRDSDDRRWVRASYRSEWTVGARHSLLFVAFPVGVRQQVLGLVIRPARRWLSSESVIARGVLARTR